MQSKSACPLVLVFFFLAYAASLVGCAQEEDPVPVLSELSWASIEGSERYTVRLWSGYRLLLEETSSDTSLVLEETLREMVAELDTLSLEVLGYSGWEGEEREEGRMRRPLRP